MSKIRNKVNLDKTLSFTQSSYAYKDPYNPKGGLVYKMRSKVSNFFTLRNIENDFIDFKPFYVDTQFREIYTDLHNAYRRSDKVILQRSLSQGMFDVYYYVVLNILVCESAVEGEKTQPFLQDDQADTFNASKELLRE